MRLAWRKYTPLRLTRVRAAGCPILCVSVVCKGWGFRFNSVTTLGAAASALKAAALDFPPAISQSSRLPPFPPDQFNFNPAVQGMSDADQRSYCQIPRLVLHRRNL